MTAEEKQQTIETFINACPLHNLRRGTCDEGVGGTICDGDCKYVKKFENEIKTD